MREPTRLKSSPPAPPSSLLWHDPQTGMQHGLIRTSEMGINLHCREGGGGGGGEEEEEGSESSPSKQ